MCLPVCLPVTLLSNVFVCLSSHWRKLVLLQVTLLRSEKEQLELALEALALP